MATELWPFLQLKWMPAEYSLNVRNVDNIEILCLHTVSTSQVTFPPCILGIYKYEVVIGNNVSLNVVHIVFVV